MAAKGAEVGGLDWECGVGRHRLLQIGWTNNKGGLHSRGIYVQYPVINHSGREYEEESIYMHN